MKSILMLFLGLVMITGCGRFMTKAENTARPTETREVAKTHEGDKAYLMSETIAFEQGSAALTAGAKDKLRAMVNNLRSQGDLDKFKIAAWSDREFVPDRDLSKADRKLASDRLNAINDCLKDDLEVSNTDTFNMAERSNWLARLFRTDDAELKSIFSRKDSPITDDEFDIIRKNGSPSHAVVMGAVEHDDD